MRQGVGRWEIENRGRCLGLARRPNRGLLPEALKHHGTAARRLPEETLRRNQAA